MSSLDFSEELAHVDAVTASFVEQFYAQLVSGSDELFAWYGNDSLFSQGTVPMDKPTGALIQVCGGDTIREPLTKMCDRLKGSKVKLLNVDGQRSRENAVLVSVWGVFISAEETQYFYHTVVLAPVAKDQYYICNDIMRFLPPVTHLPPKKEPEEPKEPAPQKQPANQERKREAVEPPAAPAPSEPTSAMAVAVPDKPPKENTNPPAEPPPVTEPKTYASAAREKRGRKR